ncbi:MAG TPA: hypothetical protein VGM90_10435 [Kofleriaceae bacterium]
MRGFWLLLTLAACGRLDFVGVPSGTEDGGRDAAVSLQLVYSDEFDDGDPGTNTLGMGSGFHAEGAAFHEGDGLFQFDIAGADYASSGLISHDTFAGMRTRRVEWDFRAGPATTYDDMGAEFAIELSAVALGAGNDNFNGELYFNTTGGMVATVATNLEDSDHISASLRLVATDTTKNTMCNFNCTGMQDLAYGSWTDLGPLATARIHVVLDIDENGFRYSFEPPATLDSGALGAAWSDMSVAALTTMSPGFYVAAYGGNNFIARASGYLERILLWE